jgi:hypothetical protein
MKHQEIKTKAEALSPAHPDEKKKAPIPSVIVPFH